MIGTVERYSSPAGKRRAGRFFGTVMKTLVVTLLLFLTVSQFLASTYRIESVSMEPALDPAQRVIVSSLAYGPRVPFSAARLPGLQVPHRGELVVIQPPFFREASLFSRILEPLAAFFSLQKGTLHRDLYNARVNGYMVKRVIGIPGDTVRVSGYRASIKTQGASAFVPEQQLISAAYVLQTVLNVPGVTDATPLAGNAPEILLKPNEYFVLGDNRPDSSDSRSWGPLAAERIVGRVIYRYWPPNALGKL
jgi:signal peptidase I